MAITIFLFNCVRNTPGIPPEGIYFAFIDNGKTTLLLNGNIIAHRVSLTDSTKILKSSQLKAGTVNILDVRNPNFKSIFQFRLYDSLIVRGVNKLRLTYNGKSDIDWLEFYSGPDEWVNPERVKFNGKSVDRSTVNEPVVSSYWYVLE